MSNPSSRSGVSRGSGPGGGVVVGNMIASLCESAAHKQESLRSAIADNHGYAKAAAQHLAVGGDVERLLKSLCPQVLNEREVEEFFVEQRRRLREVAERNAENEIAVRSFVGACNQLKHDALQYNRGDDAAVEGSSNGGSVPEDFGPVIQDLMKKQSENLANQHDDTVHKLVREIKIQLGEEKEKLRLPGGRDGDDDEDDIEVVNTGSGIITAATQGGGLKCPLTSALLEEPYKNKVCGHVYSKEAILQYIRTQKSKRRPCKCPTAGCANGNVTEDQLEKDAMMEINVNRERRRIDKHRLDMASQASQVDDDDDEEEEVAVF